MKIKVGVMGSAGEITSIPRDAIADKCLALGQAIAKRDVILLTGATTGTVYQVGKAAHESGTFHVGISPAHNLQEHLERFKLPVDACDVLIYTGFGLKGRNVVLVRSCDIVLFIAGAMGSLNEFTIAHDEGKIIGCLTHTGGVADEADYLLQKFSKATRAQIFQGEEPNQLVANCISAFRNHDQA